MQEDVIDTEKLAVFSRQLENISVDLIEKFVVHEKIPDDLKKVLLGDDFAEHLGKITKHLREIESVQDLRHILNEADRNIQNPM